jgi:hypothetical protein
LVCAPALAGMSSARPVNPIAAALRPRPRIAAN